MAKDYDSRTIAFFLRDKVDYSISDLYCYINSEYKGIDCLDLKKEYISLQNNGSDIDKILSSYVYSKFMSCIDVEAEVPDDINVEEMISENIDIFFDVSDSTDEGILFIECAQ